MKLISELSESLNGYFGYDKRRIDCLVKLLLALVVAQTVNLKRLSVLMFGKAKVDSHYRRLQRFFSDFRFDYCALARLLFHIFKLAQGKHYLILDRTNWQLGKKNINLLFLCVAYKKIAIPIFWLALNKRGNSSTRERIALIQRFIRVFGKDNIAGVLGDREFIGKAWFSYLQKQGISFYFRVKKDADTTNSKGQSIAISWLFHQLKLNEFKRISTTRNVYGHQLYITGMRLADDFLIVVTNQEPQQAQAIEVYARRWEIETLFGCLKSKGFRFEETAMVNRNRIKKLVAVLTLAFCWAHLTGEWQAAQHKPIPLKKHGRPQHNFFRYGLNWIAQKLNQRGYFLKQLYRVFLQFFGPPQHHNSITLASV
jgi:Transposase DDE domain.